MQYFPSNSMSLIGIALVIYLFYWAYQTSRSPASKVPGPSYTKWTSLVLNYHWLSASRSQYVHALHKKYGPVVRIAPDYVDFAEADAARTIYTVRETFRKSDFYKRVTTSAHPGIFNTSDVDIHRKHRRLLAGPLSDSSLQTVVPQINAKVELAIQKIKDEMETRGAADVFKWWLFMATDVIGELTFGKSFEMLAKGEKNEYIRDLELTGPTAALRSTFPTLVSLASILPLPLFKTASRAVRNMERYANQSLNRYKTLVENNPETVPQTLFTKLFKAGDDEKMSFDDIRTDAQGYIIAGSDTTSNTLTFLIWSVCRHPEIKSRLVKELQTLPSDFTEVDLRKLPFLSNVIEETLRLYSAAPSGLPRVVPPGGATIAGYYLGEGNTVCSQAYTLHRDPNVFPDPESFIPSRWDSATKAMRDSFMPFGGGARICIGLHLAMVEIRLATARFFREFPDGRMSEAEGMSDEDMKPEIYFLMTPKGRRCLIQGS